MLYTSFLLRRRNAHGSNPCLGTGSFGTLPVGWRPPVEVTMPFCGRDGTSQRRMVLKADGTMTYQNQGGSQNGDPFNGTFTYLSANL